MGGRLRVIGALLSLVLACATPEQAALSAPNAGRGHAAGGSGGAAGSAEAAPAGAGSTPSDAAAMDAAVTDAGGAPLDGGMRDAAIAQDASMQDAAVPSDAPLPADLAYAAFNELFYTVTDGKGYYLNSSGDDAANHWWTQAELIEVAIDAYDRKPSDAYRVLMTELVYGFVDEQGADWSYNEFNDDIAWMVIASARAHLHTGNPDFLGYAQRNWDVMYARAWDASFAGGGLWWKTDKQSKNACSNGPAAIGAYLLYEATGDRAYLTKAIAIYAWLRGALFDTTSGAVYDNRKVGGGGDDWTFTYNSGTFIGAANYLYRETGDRAYLDDAKRAASFFKDELSDSDGLVDENAISGDGAAFKAIGFRWLAKLVFDNGLESEYLPWLQYNANRAWANRRAGDDISWNDWRVATPHMILDSVGASATVQILQVVPPGGPDVTWYNDSPQDARSEIQAESCDEMRGMIIEASGAGGRQLGGVVSGSWARYGHVDFTATAPTRFVARAAADPSAGGEIEIRIGARDGQLIGTCPIESTGGWANYADFTTTLTGVTGVHDVYLNFKSSAGRPYVANLDWFRLLR